MHMLYISVVLYGRQQLEDTPGMVSKDIRIMCNTFWQVQTNH